MSLAPGIVVDRPIEHELATGDVLRPLDPTEHNMERLNVTAHGSGRTYHTLLVEGPLSRSQLERALDTLASRHPLLRVRIVRGADGRLHYAPTRAVPVNYIIAADVSAWPELVEADMNAGPIASDSGPLFAFALIEPPGLADGASGKRLVLELGHHGACDGISSLALLHELLEQLAHPHAIVRLEDRPLSDPFSLELAVPELAEIETDARRALEGGGAGRGQELQALSARLERLEQRLLAERDAKGRLPSALKTVHGLISTLGAELIPSRRIVPEVEVGAGPDRYERVRTALLHRTLGVEPTRALQRAAKERAMSVYGVFAAAWLMALAAGRAPHAEADALPPERLALASAVSLRNQLVPALEPHDLRMAVDILISRIAVEPGAHFWDLARRTLDDVQHAVANGRALSSYFRTVPRDFGNVPTGVGIPLLSNLGRAKLKTQYGPLRVLELGAAMTAHGSFQLGMLVVTFDERLGISFYCETPTVSRATLERLAACVVDTLTRVAAGEEPALAVSR